MFLASKKKSLLLFAFFAIFVDISGPFFVSSLTKSCFLLGFFSCLSKSGILLHLLFLRYLPWVFSASKKNPCYFDSC